MDTELLSYLETFITENRKNLFKQVLANRTKHLTVVLEDTFQPHNTSAIMRTCDIFGIQDLYTVENEFASKVSRHIARGSQKWVTRKRYKGNFENNLQLCFDDLKNDGYQIIATSPHIDSCYLSDFKVDQKTAIVFGREKEGISDFTKNNADGFLKIPMYGFTESFNISVAVAIILENLTTKLRKSTLNWQLTDAEKQELYALWVQKSIKNAPSIIEYYQKNKLV